MEEREDFSKPPVGLFFLAVLVAGLIVLSCLCPFLTELSRDGSSSPLSGLLILLIRLGRLRVGELCVPPILLALWCVAWWFWTRDRRRRSPPPEAEVEEDLRQRDWRTRWFLWLCLAAVCGAIAYVASLNFTVFVRMMSAPPLVVYPPP